MITAFDTHVGTSDDVSASLRSDSTLERVTDLVFQAHSVDPPHPYILRSIELVAEKVAPALGWTKTAAADVALVRRSRMMSTVTKDIIDLLAGIESGSSLDGIRARRLQARENAQKSYLALFEPSDFGDVPATERFAVAAFVASLHEEPTVANFYLAKLARPELVEALQAEIERGKTKGPYGAFPAGPLSAEDTTGLIYRVARDRTLVLGSRLAAALEHAICWCSARAMRTLQPCRRCSMPPGRRRLSLRFRNSSRSCRFRSALSLVCVRSAPRSGGASRLRPRPARSSRP